MLLRGEGRRSDSASSPITWHISRMEAAGRPFNHTHIFILARANPPVQVTALDLFIVSNFLDCKWIPGRCQIHTVLAGNINQSSCSPPQIHIIKPVLEGEEPRLSISLYKKKPNAFLVPSVSTVGHNVKQPPFIRVLKMWSEHFWIC